MKKFTLTCLPILFVIALSAQKQINDPNAQVRNVSGFHAIRIGSGIDLYLTQSSTEAVAVSANNVEDRDHIITVVEKGVLKIKFDENIWKLWRIKGRKLKAYVSIINIDHIDISAGSDVMVDGSLKSTNFSMDVSSGASFNGKVEATALNVDQSSGAKVVLSGSAGDMSIDGSSGAHFHGYDFVVNNCKADMSSGAKAEITVTKELSADVSSGGHVSYKGAGVIRRIKSSSGGNVSRRD
jgi:hypothetical protein